MREIDNQQIATQKGYFMQEIDNQQIANDL